MILFLKNLFEGLRRFYDTGKVIVYRYFLTGLISVVPVIMTIWIFQRGIDALDQWVPHAYQPQQLFGFHIPGWGGILLAALLILTGFLTRNFLGRWVVWMVDRFLNAVPLVRGIYRLFKQVLQAVVGSREKMSQFNSVVLVEFPRKGVWTLAFVTGKVQVKELQEEVSEPLISVYVPTTPNPTGGYFLLVPESQAVQTQYSVDEAFKMIVSLGIVLPLPAPGRTGGIVPLVEEKQAEEPIFAEPELLH